MDNNQPYNQYFAKFLYTRFQYKEKKAINFWWKTFHKLKTAEPEVDRRKTAADLREKYVRNSNKPRTVKSAPPVRLKILVRQPCAPINF